MQAELAFQNDPLVEFSLGHRADWDKKNQPLAGKHYRRAYELAPNCGHIAREYLLWAENEDKKRTRAQPPWLSL